MNYNDFPILTNQEYQLMNENFSTIQPNRKAQISKICFEINTCKNSTLTLSNKFNKKICDSLNQTHTTLEKLLNNLTSTFNINETSNNTIVDMNIFSFLNKVVNIISLIQVWSTTEEKTYYKSIAQKSIVELLNILNSLIKSLQLSNVQFFKYM